MIMPPTCAYGAGRGLFGGGRAVSGPSETISGDSTASGLQVLLVEPVAGHTGADGLAVVIRDQAIPAPGAVQQHADVSGSLGGGRALMVLTLVSPTPQGVSDGSRGTAPPIDVPDEALVALALCPTQPLPNSTVHSPAPSGTPHGPRGGFPLFRPGGRSMSQRRSRRA